MTKINDIQDVFDFNLIYGKSVSEDLTKTILKSVKENDFSNSGVFKFSYFRYNCYSNTRSYAPNHPTFSYDFVLIFDNHIFNLDVKENTKNDLTFSTLEVDKEATKKHRLKTKISNF
jgi:hypothetical protein